MPANGRGYSRGKSRKSQEVSMAVAFRAPNWPSLCTKRLHPTQRHSQSLFTYPERATERVERVCRAFTNVQSKNNDLAPISAAYSVHFERIKCSAAAVCHFFQCKALSLASASVVSLLVYRFLAIKCQGLACYFGSLSSALSCPKRMEMRKINTFWYSS